MSSVWLSCRASSSLSRQSRTSFVFVEAPVWELLEWGGVGLGWVGFGQVGLGWVGLGPVRFGAVRSMGFERGGEGDGTQRTEALRDQGERAEVGLGRGEDVLKVENCVRFGSDLFGLVWFGLAWFGLQAENVTLFDQSPIVTI